MRTYIYTNTYGLTGDIIDPYRRVGYSAPVGVSLEDIEWYDWTLTPVYASDSDKLLESYSPDYGLDWFSVTSEVRKAAVIYCDSAPVNGDYYNANHSGTGTIAHPFRNLNDAISKARCMVDALCCVPVCIRVSGTLDYSVSCCESSSAIMQDMYYSEFPENIVNRGCLFAYNAYGIFIDFTECTIVQTSWENPKGLFLSGCTISGMHIPKLDDASGSQSFGLQLHFRDVTIINSSLMDCYFISYGNCAFINSTMHDLSVNEADYHSVHAVYTLAYNCIVISDKTNAVCDAYLYCTFNVPETSDDSTLTVYGEFIVAPVIDTSNITSVHISHRYSPYAVHVRDFNVDDQNIRCDISGVILDSDITCKSLGGGMYMHTDIVCDDFSSVSLYDSNITANSVTGPDCIIGNCINSTVDVVCDSVYRFMESDFVINSTLSITDRMEHYGHGTDLYISCGHIQSTEVHINREIAEPIVKPTDGNLLAYIDICGVKATTAIESSCTINLDVTISGFESACEYTRSEVITDVCGMQAESYSNCSSTKILESTCITVDGKPKELTSIWSNCIV